MIPDSIPAYITWERYLANQQRLAANRSLPTTPGAPRSGPSLLSGLVYCGRCGQRMRVDYHAKGKPVYYVCIKGCVQRAEPVCQSLAGNPLEALVAAEVLRAIEPARWELHEQTLADLQREQQRLDQHWQQRLERAQIQADRAARHYRAVDPENRLVARELERRVGPGPRGARGLEGGEGRVLAPTTPGGGGRDPQLVAGPDHHDPGTATDRPLPGGTDHCSCPGTNRMGRRDDPLGGGDREPPHDSASCPEI